MGKGKVFANLASMNDRKQQALLEALTPEIRAYLFPGWEPYAFREECSFGMACYELADEDMVFEACPTPKPAKAAQKPAPRKSLRLPRFGIAAAREAAQSQEDLDPKTAALLKEIERIQKEYNVSIEDLEILLGYRVTLSPLHITPAGKLFLPDFDNVEVRMDNVSKALYFLYLRHPKGVPFKDMESYREELLKIYGSICGRDNPEEIEKSIDHLVNPLGNALNVAASRIKIAFRNVISDRVARFYYINGTAREAKKIPLDRDLVIWL